MKKRIELEDKIRYVKNGGDLKRFKSSEIIALQEYALDIKDVALYDELEEYWSFKKFA